MRRPPVPCFCKTPPLTGVTAEKEGCGGTDRYIGAGPVKSRSKRTKGMGMNDVIKRSVPWGTLVVSVRLPPFDRAPLASSLHVPRVTVALRIAEPNSTPHENQPHKCSDSKSVYLSTDRLATGERRHYHGSRHWRCYCATAAVADAGVDLSQQLDLLASRPTQTRQNQRTQEREPRLTESAFWK